MRDRLQPDRSDRTRQAQSDIVKNAEDYAMSHAGEQHLRQRPVQSRGVSERTLEYAFKEVWA